MTTALDTAKRIFEGSDKLLGVLEHGAPPHSARALERLYDIQNAIEDYKGVIAARADKRFFAKVIETLPGKPAAVVEVAEGSLKMIFKWAYARKSRAAPAGRRFQLEIEET